MSKESNKSGARRGEAQADETNSSGIGKRFSSLLQRSGDVAGRLAGSVKEAAKTSLLKQALEARERGNLPAAFWLLHEEFESSPEDEEVALAYWDAAVSYDHCQHASPAAALLVRRHSQTGQADLGAQYWMELTEQVPDALADPASLARLLPALESQLAEEPNEEQKKLHARKQAAMHHALRAIVDERNDGLTPGIAAHVAELAREIDAESAIAAARIALEAPDLHDTKKRRLHELILDIDPNADLPPLPEEPEPPPLRTPAPRPGKAPPAGQRDPAKNHPLREETRRASGLSEEELEALRARLPTPAPVTPDPEAAAQAAKSPTPASAEKGAEPASDSGPSVAGAEEAIAQAAADEEEGVVAQIEPDAASEEDASPELEAVAEVTPEAPSAAEVAELETDPISPEDVPELETDPEPLAAEAELEAEADLLEATDESELDSEPTGVLAPKPRPEAGMDSVPELEVDLTNDGSGKSMPELETDLESEIEAAFDMSQLQDPEPGVDDEPEEATSENEPAAAAAEPTRAQPAPAPNGRSVLALVGEIENFSDEGIAFKLAKGRDTTIPCEKVQAVAVAQIGDPTAEPLFLIDFLLNWKAEESASLRVIRVEAADLHAPTPLQRDDGAAMTLSDLVAEVLEQGQPAMLPSPDAVLGVNVPSFETKAAYEEEVLGASA